ncbi:MAG TPA: hypothetical protein VJQ44_08725 [Gemmatimonadales bacterium]|nr:hypothetical protein [Gemmatimonadales bacterium]
MSDRIVAAILAAIWIAAGLGALVVGLWLRPALLPVLLAPFALGYGWLWVRVARTGRRQPWPFRQRLRG